MRQKRLSVYPQSLEGSYLFITKCSQDRFEIRKDLNALPFFIYLFVFIVMEMKREKLELPICKALCSFHCPSFLPQ